MVEKVGHSKRMQITRKAWLDDTKASRRDPSPDRQASQADDIREGAAGRESSIFGDIDMEKTSAGGDAPDDDELDALMAETNANGTVSAQQSRLHGEDEPDADELDALMAESAPARPNAPAAAQKTTRRGPFEDDSDDEDELEALMAEQVVSATQATPGSRATVGANNTAKDSSNEFADEEEVMASMGW